MSAFKWLKWITIGLLAVGVAFATIGCDDDDDDDSDGETTVVVVTNVVDDVVVVVTNVVDEVEDEVEDEEEEEEVVEPQVLHTGTQSVGGAADPLFQQTPDCEAPGPGTMTATMTWSEGGEVHAWLNRSDESEAESQDVSPIILSHSANTGQDWWVEIRNGTIDVQKNVTITVTFVPNE